jgi:hypothetical protein
LIKNNITNTRGNCKKPQTIFLESFSFYFKKKGAGPALAQLQGWPQPSRVGWADVPAHQTTAGYCAEHSNQLII